ncbi:probable jasmonic acid carboxyl methyltransferase 2 isoform X2 [Spinacia oleracea]|uniref:Probable jasmonic acid carboxyl methyltransferase 2 isoform X2 n=1 Tax=Spinacia oleracea TaxID=3562 RepID=A0ABM3RQU1_SPIOL|nr:probable jasmonic acid carboxyl methyltransferase 2 isoform X2 [Spinacia oleracea]
MEVENILHMKEGVGQSSYAKNSLLQRTMIAKAKPVLQESIRGLYHALQPECLMIADLGCSSGPNSLMVVSEIIDTIDEERKNLNRKSPKFGVFLNDLQGNDFNAIFNLLPSFYQSLKEKKDSDFGPCFVSGTPKSFYGSVFPDQFLHFVHSSYSVHWLSQVPRGLESRNGEALNKGNIYIAKTSPPEIAQAYYAQFKEDFTLFLRSRGKEMVPGGHMVLTLQGSVQRNDPDSLWELLGSTLHTMVQEGVIEQEKLDRFNMPFYSPTAEEVKELVEAEGLFSVNKLETFKVDWSVDTNQNLENRAKFVANTIRAVTESLLTTAYGEAAMDDLFLRFSRMVKERMDQEQSEYLNIVVSMIKRD